MTDESKTTVDWPAFLRGHDMHFDKLPSSWRDAPHFGNGMVGSMIHMRDGRLCVEVFRADVCDHLDESYGWTAYSRPHFRIGYFTLETEGRPVGCEWRLDLWNAELSGTITTDKGTLGVRHLVHADEMEIVTELTPSEGESACRWNWHSYEAQTTRPGYPRNEEERAAFSEKYGDHYVETLKPPAENPAGRLERRGDVKVWVQDLLAGGQYATAWAERAERGTRTHIVSIANRYPDASAADAALSDVQRFLEVDRMEWIELHRAWWHGYYQRSYVSIPDADLESLYWQTIYRYACCSRAGRYYVDTAGLWFQASPWPYSTHDWNTQSAHWGVYAANRLEQGEEVVNRLHAGLDNLIAAVEPSEWQEDSAYLHLATAADMSGSRRSDRRYYDCVGCLPWILHNAWWQYRFSMDDAMLREKIFPLLRRSINLYFHLAFDGDDGRIHLPATYSPETRAVPDCNFDLALFKWGCHVLLKACERLRIDDPLIPRWRDVTRRLVDFPTDDNGFMLGHGETASVGHRHLSHLLMIYPLYLVNIEQEGVAELLSRSYVLAHGDRDVVDGEAESLAAMVQTHAAPIGAAIGDSERALEGLKRLQSELEPNGLWGCGGPPCIESTLGLANIIQQMLIQSWSDPAADEPGPIHVFPALPTSWEDVEFHDLRAEGAFLVSARRRGGRTEWVRVKSLAGEPCRVRHGIESDFEVNGSREFSVLDIGHGVVQIDLKRGEVVELVSIDSAWK